MDFVHNSVEVVYLCNVCTRVTRAWCTGTEAVWQWLYETVTSRVWVYSWWKSTNHSPSPRMFSFTKRLHRFQRKQQQLLLLLLAIFILRL